MIVSGDSDFSPLVSKLKELGKHVIGLGLVEATSNLLRDNCDEFIYSEDLDRHEALPISGGAAVPEVKRKVFNLLMDSLVALRRENKDVIFSSMVKDTMKRKKPSFNEEYHGYRTFSELLEDGARHGLIEIEKHKTSGTYVVNRFGDELRRGTPPAIQQLAPPVPLALPAPKQILLPPPAPLPEREPNRRNDRGPRPATPTPTPRVAESRPQQIRVLTTPPTQPRGPLPKSVTSARSDDEDDRPQLGRSLIEEIDDSDDLDEIPSYAPKRAVPDSPVAAAPEKIPAPRSRVASPKRVAAVNAPATIAEKPAASVPAKPRTAAVEKPAAPPRVIEPIRPAPKPAAKPAADDEGFGSGLDD